MASNLAGKTALITGGARRVGRAIAIALANAGVNVIIHYNRSASEAEELVELIKKMGPKAWAIQADLSAKDDLEGLINKTIQTAGQLDILINNASTFPASKFSTVTLDDLITSIRTDAWAPFELGRRFALEVKKGHIINLLDSRIVGYDWKHVGYHAAKHLLELFTRMMAIQLAPSVAVNAIAPGLILPPEGKDSSYLEPLKGELPLKRIGSPEQVADAVLYLVSSDFITGQVIFVDGGRHLNGANLG